MKYLLSITAPVLLVVVAITINSDNGSSAQFYDYPTFTEFHHTCDGASATGSTCSGTCPDACGCTCNSGFWSCSCSCSCAGGDDIADAQLTLAPKEKWEKTLAIVAEEDTENSRRLYTMITELYQFGSQNKIAEFNKLAETLDVEMMKLEAKTLDKIIELVVAG